MTKLLIAVLGMISLLSFSTYANEAQFLAKFSTYKSKKSLSAYQTAKVFGSHFRKSPASILKRYISAKYNGSRNTDSVIVEAVDAFKESGLSYDQSLAAVSDIVGQLPETLNSIYTRASGSSKRVAIN